MYAIIESCGRQYKVQEGDVIFFEKLDTEEGKKVTFDNVVLVSDGKDVKVGAPYVKGAKVEGEVVAHFPAPVFGLDGTNGSHEFEAGIV